MAASPRRLTLRAPELVSLGAMALGLILAVLGILLRVLKVGRELDVQGFTVYYRYPAAATLFLVGLVLFGLGLLAFLVVLGINLMRRLRSAP